MNRSRELALEQYKSQPPDRGAYAVRCLASGRVWVGATSSLRAARNGTWFLLRHGDHRDASLQADWRTFGEDAFAFEVLETLDADVAPVLVPDLLKEKRRDWASQLSAGVLL